MQHLRRRGPIPSEKLSAGQCNLSVPGAMPDVCWKAAIEDARSRDLRPYTINTTARKRDTLNACSDRALAGVHFRRGDLLLAKPVSFWGKGEHYAKERSILEPGNRCIGSDRVSRDTFNPGAGPARKRSRCFRFSTPRTNQR